MASLSHSKNGTLNMQPQTLPSDSFNQVGPQNKGFQNFHLCDNMFHAAHVGFYGNPSLLDVYRFSVASCLFSFYCRAFVCLLVAFFFVALFVFVFFSSFCFRVRVVCVFLSWEEKIRHWKRARPRTTTATPGSTTLPCRATRALARRDPGHESREKAAGAALAPRKEATGMKPECCCVVVFLFGCMLRKKEGKRTNRSLTVFWYLRWANRIIELGF